jgi:molecular chaperone DnaK
MPYLLSVDLGTTFSAAAIFEGSAPEIVSLGSRTATIPSVVALRPDGTVLIGEAAERRAVTEPTRVAREFKRRLGDPVPTVIGGTPYGAEALMAHLLRGIFDQVTERQGERPDRIVLSHPANYGPYKLDLLEQVGRLADLEGVDFITEPQAAAIHYSEGQRIEAGEVVAVYDLGGGTFDAALVLRGDGGFELLGTPDGMERFGGIDLDEAVFMHVRRSLGGAIEKLDPNDPAAVSALARLREDCRLAKEGLSSDTDAAIPVMLPNLHTEVRLVRSEFEDMIRPRLRETIATLERVVRSAGRRFEDLSRVLLVGGSSRIPLVSEIVRETVGRPVALDAHPKYAIVLGAARAGRLGATRRTARLAPTLQAGADVPASAAEAPAESAPIVAQGGLPEAEPAAAVPGQTEAAATEPAVTPPEKSGRESASPEEAAMLPAGGLVEEDALQAGEEPGRGPTTKRVSRRRLLVIAAGLIGLAAAVTLPLVFVMRGGTSTTTAAGAASTTAAEAAASTTAVTDGGTSEAPGGLPPVEGDAPFPDVLTIYLTDYRLPDGGDDWGLWGSGESAPPEDIASDYYPLIGPYDLRDEATVAGHFAAMRAAGIGTVGVVWAGPDSAGDAAMPIVLEMAAHYGLSFVLVFPPTADLNQDILEALATEAQSRYGDSPSWLRLPGRDSDEPRPVVLLSLPDAVGIDPGAWAPLFERLTLTVIVKSTDPAWVDAGADGLMFGDLERSYGWALGLPESILYVPLVSPGYSELWAGNPGAYADRRSGDLYRENWELAHAVRVPDLVVIQSFNVWSDGSQIEPATPEPPQRPGGAYLTYEPLAPEGYLQLTRELVEASH